MTDKGLISNNLILKWAEEMNRYFSKEDMQITVREIKVEEVLFRFQRQESRAGL